MRPAEVRFYLDADVRGLGIVLAGLRSDVTYPGDPGAEIHKRKRPPCPITTTDLPDEAWIPEVARLGWLIITRDSKIAENRREIARFARFPLARSLAAAAEMQPSRARRLRRL